MFALINTLHTTSLLCYKLCIAIWSCDQLPSQCLFFVIAEVLCCGLKQHGD